MHQTVHSAAAWPLVFQKQRLPRKVFRSSIAWLSDSLRAPCAAGSASQDGLPRHHARLASGRWSGATGQAFHPQGSDERFQICFLTFHPPFPSFAWHNVIDRGHFALAKAAYLRYQSDGAQWLCPGPWLHVPCALRSNRPQSPTNSLAPTGHALLGQQELAFDQAVREIGCIEEIVGLSL